MRMVHDFNDNRALCETLEQKLHRIEPESDADTAVLFDPNKIMGHPAMRAIIALGEPIVPLILREF
jgi:hypothetical protein